ncbi:MAG: hypothetical protein ACXABY_15140 [Candidatus Thorarchaeota archaeon]|jgi:hypothetical protein
MMWITDPAAFNTQEIQMEAKVKEEVLNWSKTDDGLNWSKTDDGETFELLIGVELEVPKGTDKGQVAALRKGMSLSITRLARLMRDAQTPRIADDVWQGSAWDALEAWRACAWLWTNCAIARDARRRNDRRIERGDDWMPDENKLQKTEPNPIEQAMVILRDRIRTLSDRLKPVCEAIPEEKPPSNTSCALLGQIQEILDTILL